MTERRKVSVPALGTRFMDPESATKFTNDEEMTNNPEIDSSTLPTQQVIELNAQRLHASKFLPKTRVIS